MSEAKTKKCTKCKMDIPEQAEKCPFCQSSQIKLKPKELGCGCVVLIFLAVLFSFFIDGDPKMVDATAPKATQQAQAEKIYTPAYMMARTALTDSFNGKMPNDLQFGREEDCVISWMSYKDTNWFRVKLAVDNIVLNMREYIFVDLIYLGDGKWNVVGFEDAM